MVIIGEINKGEIMPLSFPVEDKNGVVNLTGVTIEMVFSKYEGERIVKPASLVDGEGYILIDSAWFTNTGLYTVQPKITFTDGKPFYGEPQKLYVIQTI